MACGNRRLRHRRSLPTPRLHRQHRRHNPTRRNPNHRLGRTRRSLPRRPRHRSLHRRLAHLTPPLPPLSPPILSLAPAKAGAHPLPPYTHLISRRGDPCGRPLLPSPLSPFPVGATGQSPSPSLPPSSPSTPPRHSGESRNPVPSPLVPAKAGTHLPSLISFPSPYPFSRGSGNPSPSPHAHLVGAAREPPARDTHAHCLYHNRLPPPFLLRRRHPIFSPLSACQPHRHSIESQNPDSPLSCSLEGGSPIPFPLTPTSFLVEKRATTRVALFSLPSPLFLLSHPGRGLR